MKSEKKIFTAFILNLLFSIFEFIGGTIINSVAIISDSIHDLSDSLSIGIAYFLEKKSKKQPDENYTYGYSRYSVIGSFITITILIISSILVVYTSLKRMFNPEIINYNGMIIFAIVGVIINVLAFLFTKNGHSLNQKSVNLHMLEDVLGWIVVLIGAIIMKFTNLTIIDSLLSLFVALFILYNAIKHLKEILDLFLEKIPSNINVNKIKEELSVIDNVIDVHDIHIWSMDGYNNFATMHVVTNKNNKKIKDEVREVLKKYNIFHVTIELEGKNEKCSEIDYEKNVKRIYNFHNH